MADESGLVRVLQDPTYFVPYQIFNKTDTSGPPEHYEVRHDFPGYPGDPTGRIVIDGGYDVHLGLGGGSLPYKILQLVLGLEDVYLGLIVVGDHPKNGYRVERILVLDENCKFQESVK